MKHPDIWDKSSHGESKRINKQIGEIPKNKINEKNKLNDDVKSGKKATKIEK